MNQFEFDLISAPQVENVLTIKPTIAATVRPLESEKKRETNNWLK